ncbi:MAG: DALR anticodon-binding domain-containing protein, partial [Novosphingobium sp.]|uniref:DALR anticodon-binding domain-containing protein n=1 Tax=Novosphingobium sp. TaxID=1874826 RepID=UPI003C7C4A4B
IRILTRAQYKSNVLIEGLRAKDQNFDVTEADGELWLVHGDTKIERIDRSTFTDPDDPWSREKSPVDGMFDLRFFLIERLKVQQKTLGVRHDLIEAVFALRAEDRLTAILARVHALQAFVGTDDGANLLAGYKRAANILKKEGFESVAAISLSYTPEPAEDALIKALDMAEPRAAAAVAAEDFSGAMAALASLRGPIDAFFEQVTVNDADDQKRSYRLALLARLRGAVHGVADFSRIEG